MAMNRNQFLKLMVENLREVFWQHYREQDLVYPRIFDVKTSKLRMETDESVAGIGMLDVKAESEAIKYDDFVMGYEKNYIHTAYAKGLRFSRELIDDERYGVMSGRTKALARSARYRKEYDHAAVFNNAVTAGYTGGDGKVLLATDHPLARGGTYGNRASGAVQLTLAGLETAFTNFKRMVDDANLLIGATPKTLLIPPELEYDAYEILRSTGKPYTADNEDNYFKGQLDVVVWPFLTGTTCWFILADKGDGAPISFDRVPVEYENDTDFNTKDILTSAYTRYSNGWSDWRWVFGNPGV